MKLGKLLSPRLQACPYKTWRGKSFLQPFFFKTLMIHVLSSHGGSTTQGFFWPVVEKHICVDVIKIILALVYLMTAKCYVLSCLVNIKCWNRLFLNLSQPFPLFESNFQWQHMEGVINILSLLSLWKLLKHSSAKWSEDD